MTIAWENFFAGRAGRITGSQIRNFFRLTEQPEVISFAGGFPGSELFPREEIARILAAIVSENGRGALQYAPTEGAGELRAYLAEKMAREGAPCAAEEVVVIDGAQQGIDLLCRILVDPGQPVLVEEPAYIGGMGAIRSYGGMPVGVPMDGDGILPEALAFTLKRLRAEGLRPRFLYTVPNFHNPTGCTASPKRRRAVLELASCYNFIIIEDNPYGEICYEGTVPPSYRSMDAGGRVVYLGSYSKTFIPGIRIGWMTAARPLLEKVILAKQTMDLCSSSLGQHLACRLSEEGYVDQHVEKLIGVYRRKRDAMLAGMETCFPPGVRFTRPRGGFFVWVTFPGYYPEAETLLMRALERKVAFVHGRGFFCNGGGGRTARFSFSQPAVEEIQTGIGRLGELFAEIEESAPVKAAHG